MKLSVLAGASALALAAVLNPVSSSAAISLDANTVVSVQAEDGNLILLADRGRGGGDDDRSGHGGGGDDDHDDDHGDDDDHDDDHGGDDDDDGDGDDDSSGSGRDKPRIPGGSGCDDPGDVAEHAECRA